MARLLTLSLLLVSIFCNAQKAAVALEGDHTLHDRYALMKGNSQTFQDYKVIKETILDGVWRIAMDSVHALERGLAEAEARINQLEQSQKAIEVQMQQNEAAVQEMKFDSSHITVLGLPFSKALFLTIVGFGALGLLVLLGTTAAGARLLQRSVKEKDLTIFGINAEFDEFRKKALEKEVKLSRELQNERNRLMELKSTH